MSIFEAFAVSASGLTAQRTRLETIMSNVANVSTTRTPEGTPYRRKDVVLVSSGSNDFKDCLQGVLVGGIVEDQSPFLRKYEPNHPDADKDGYVLYPNIDPAEEMTNLVAATRSFEANVTAMNALKESMNKALEIGR